MANELILLGAGASGASSGGGGGPATLSLDFTEANSEYLSMSSANFTGYDTAKFGISAWVKLKDTGWSSHLPIMMCINGSPLSGFNFFISKNGAGGAIDFRCRSNSPDESSQLTTNDGEIADTNWHHVYATFDSANATADDRMKIYVDGTEITTFATRINPTKATSTLTTDINMGKVGSNYGDALLYEVAFFSGTLPAVGDLYNGGTPPDITSETGLYSLQDPDSGVGKDSVLTADWTDNNTVQTSATIP